VLIPERWADQREIIIAPKIIVLVPVYVHSVHHLSTSIQCYW
jgi:hypothetical protein